MGRTRVLIVDSHPILGQGLASVLDQVEEIDVVGAATTVDGAMARVGDLRPEVIVVTADLGSANATLLVERLGEMEEHPAIIFLSPEDDNALTERAVHLGSSGFVLREASLEDLVSAIHWAMVGNVWISPMTLTALMSEVQTHNRPTAPMPPRELTAREQEILDLLVEGLGHKAIAGQLGLSLNTVRTHTRNIQMKLNVHSNLEAVSVALGRGARPR